MSSEDRTWTRGRTPPPASESRSLTPPPRTRESALAPSGRGDYVTHDRTYYAPFPLGGKKSDKYGKDHQYGFAYFWKDFEEHMKDLAEIAMHEEWRWTDQNGVTREYDLLRNYLSYSFMFIEQEQPKKRIVSKDENWTVYDTRLISKFATSVNPIYALFRKNNMPDKQPWVFKEWCIDWGHVLKASLHAFGPLSAPPPYDPNVSSATDELPATWTHFDPRLPISFNVNHILRDNLERLQKVAANKSDDDIAAKLEMAIEHARKPILNSRRVLPQLYFSRSEERFHPQLLMPLHLMAEPAADLALTLQMRADPDNPGTWYYEASTVLTIDMAYTNARLFDSVESPWLRDTVANRLVQPVETLFEATEVVKTESKVEDATESSLALEVDRMMKQEYEHKCIVASDRMQLARASA